MSSKEIDDFLNSDYRKRFDELYPDSDVGTQIDVEGDIAIKIARSGQCWDCGRTTFWIGQSFMTHLCSKKCFINKWNEYWEATRK